MGRLCSSLTIHISIVEVFNSMRTQLLWTSEIHRASGGTLEERTDEHLSRVSDTRHKVNILGFH